MTKYNPPIHERETDELLAIAISSVDYWQEEAIDLAKIELEKRGVTKEFINKRKVEYEKQINLADLKYQRQLELNEFESYSTTKMIYIFVVAPLILLGRWEVDSSLFELKSENYQRKFRQRLGLLIFGTCAWGLYIYLIIR